MPRGSRPSCDSFGFETQDDVEDESNRDQTESPTPMLPTVSEVEGSGENAPESSTLDAEPDQADSADAAHTCNEYDDSTPPHRGSEGEPTGICKRSML